jgi:hypothetical protein
MNRQDAINVIVRHELSKLTLSLRTDLLEEWWGIDKNDSEFHNLPASLREELQSRLNPERAGNACYDPLLHLALKFRYVGVLNSYLEKQLSALGAITEVIGEIEALERCQCCGFRVVHEPANYEICPVCKWEDDGTKDVCKYSPANHATLQGARRAFEEVRGNAELDKFAK